MAFGCGPPVAIGIVRVVGQAVVQRDGQKHVAVIVEVAPVAPREQLVLLGRLFDAHGVTLPRASELPLLCHGPGCPCAARARLGGATAAGWATGPASSGRAAG